MRRIALITALGTLAMPSAAHAITIETTDAAHPWQTWANAAQVPTWRGSLPLMVASGDLDCGGLQATGCSDLTPEVDQSSGQIMPQGTPLAAVATEIDGDQSTWSERQTLYHELGQVFWAEYMTTEDETRFMRIAGLAGDASTWSSWSYSTTRNGVTVTFAPFEWFAEGYRYCAEYGVNQPLGVNDEEGLGYPGDRAGFAAQQREVCELIDEVGAANGVPTPDQAPAHLTGRVIKVRMQMRRIRPRTRTFVHILDHHR